MTWPKDMTNTRTWNKLKTTTTHPYTEGYFKVFTSPNLKKSIEVYSTREDPSYKNRDMCPTIRLTRERLQLRGVARGTGTPLGEKMAGEEYSAKK
jgi:hypothetical protein